LTSLHSHFAVPDTVSTVRSFTIPSLSDLGYDESLATTPYRGGEKAALERLGKYLEQTKWCCDFEKPQTSPTVTGETPRPARPLPPDQPDRSG